MRFFKHGEVLAIVLPESLRKKLGVKDGDDHDFVEVEDGLLALVDKSKLAAVVKEKVATRVEVKKKDVLQEKGFMVLEGEEQAKEFSQANEQKIKSGEIKGVRGFDKRFYLMSKAFYAANYDKAVKALKDKDAGVDEVASALKVPAEAATALLCLLKEDGEVIEKRKGSYSLVK